MFGRGEGIDTKRDDNPLKKKRSISLPSNDGKYCKKKENLRAKRQEIDSS